MLAFESGDSITYIDYLMAAGNVSFQGVVGIVRITPVMKNQTVIDRRHKDKLIHPLDFQLISNLGKGGFSSVYLGI